ncbi:MAG: SDR family oxidoreductase [Flavobacteriales bacterium]|jgi:UDP-N-acetylglucosamine 4-epimerase|nr:SDR family oxidoreductase [Flavobacteriales bacterium]
MRNKFQKYHGVDLNNHSFLITGGAGFIGSNLVEYLLQFGAKKVRVLDNLSNGYYKNIEEFEKYPNFEFIQGDIRDYSTCQKAVKGIDFVSHQAALGSVPRSINDPITSNEVNVSGFLNVLEAAKNEGIIKMVYAASSSTYGDSKSLPKVEDKIGKPLSPYAVTKYVNELYGDVYANVYGFATVGLRYFNVFGPKQDSNGAYAAVIPLFMDAMIEKRAPTINGDGGQTRDFTFVDNAVQANIKALLNAQNVKTHEVCNIAFGERTSLLQLWEMIQEADGNTLDAVHGPDRAGDIRDSLADISKAKKLIGYDPGFSMAQGLSNTYNWFKNNLEFIKQNG